MKDSLQYPLIQDLFEKTLSEKFESGNIGYLDANENLKIIDWGQFYKKIILYAFLLQQTGIQKGDFCAIFLPTSLEWELFNHAIMLCGGIVVGIDLATSVENINQILTEAKVKLFITSDQEIIKTLNIINLTELRMCITLHPFDSPFNSKIIPLTSLLNRSPSKIKLENKNIPQPNDFSTLIYTSGTTGKPKGILYRYRQLLVGIDSIEQVLSFLTTEDRLICWLPMAHLFQRMANLLFMKFKGSIYFLHNSDHILKFIQKIKPTFFISVPRFYEKLYISILANHQSSGLQLHEYARHILGGNMKVMLSGSASLNKKIIEFFLQIGIPILEAYGLSENTVPIAMNKLDAFKIGSVGTPCLNNQIKIASDGEILIKGEGLFEGYYAKQQNTICFDSQGFYGTGDIGELDQEGYLTLHGRKSDMFKLSTGCKIYPSYIEMIYQTIPELDQIIITGHGKSYLIAIATLKIHEINNINTINLKDKFLNKAKVLSSYQTVKGVLLLTRKFKLENGEVTPSMKLIRKNILKNLHQEIENLYQELALKKQFLIRFCS